MDIESQESGACCGRKCSLKKYPFWDSEPKDEKSELLYAINDVPPWYLILPLSFQQFITMIGGTFLISLLILDTMCLEQNLNVKAELLASIIFVMGLATFLQSTFGIRLPIIQGCSASVLVPIFEMMKLQSIPKCPLANSENLTIFSNETIEDVEPWKVRASLISGTILLSACFQMLIGASGIMSLILRFIGPLTIAPTITLIGLSLFEIAAQKSEGQWWIALMTTLLTIIFTFYIDRLRIPLLWYTRSQKFHFVWCSPFKTAPVMLAMGFSWMICGILTATDVLPQKSTEWGYEARTDTNLQALHMAPWFRVPYPFQFVYPTISPISILAFFASILCSVVESVGDYHAAARLCGAPEPPKFAINRGIMIEGLGCFIAGLFSCPAVTTSYSENIGSIGITRVGSRRVAQFTAGILLFMGIFPKIGAVFISIPNPVIGGLFFVMFGVLTGVGLSNLQKVNLNSMRNLLVIGISIFAGLMVPNWLSKNKSSVNLGVPVLTETVTILLTISMFVGGFTAIILDNTMPGSSKDRGMEKQEHDEGTDFDNPEMNTYEIQLCQQFFQKHPSVSCLPICAKYSPKNDKNTTASKKKDSSTHDSMEKNVNVKSDNQTTRL